MPETRMERLYLEERQRRQKGTRRRWLIALALITSLAGGGAAMAAQTDLPGKGNPVVNPAGNCAPGQQPEDAPPGATAGQKC